MPLCVLSKFQNQLDLSKLAKGIDHNPVVELILMHHGYLLVHGTDRIEYCPLSLETCHRKTG